MTKTEILAAIAASTELQALAAAKDHAALAAALSVGRTKLVPTEAGNGTVLEVLGLATGNALLDVINSVADFRHVKPLVEQGRLRLDSPLAAAALQGLVGTVLTQAQADALIGRAKVPDPVGIMEIAQALEA